MTRSVSDAADIVFIALMWVIVLVRGIAMRHTQGHLLMWLALTSGITSITINQTQLADRLTEWSGTPAVAFTLDTVLAYGAVTWVNTFFLASATPSGTATWRRRQWYPWMLTIPASLALIVLAFSNHLDLYGTYTAVGEHRGSLAQTLMVVIYEATLLAHLSVMVWLFAVLSRRESNIAVRWALVAVTVTSIGVASRPVYTLVTMALPEPPWMWDTDLALQLPMPWYLLGFIAVTILGLVSVAQQRATQRRLAALQPLHEALDQVIVRRRAQLPDLAPVQALIARYTEIEDGLRHLRDYGSVEALELAQQFVQAHRVSGKRRREAIATAAWIVLTLRHLEAQTPLKKSEVTFPHVASEGGNRDIDRLADVSTAFQHHPLVKAFVDACEVREGKLHVRGLASAHS
ncbi:DUF6545 domain-containing protein [Nonomuraea ceibae]|uniref:DUF6545 domain-containing protein n=1 Tax=Nonomuraea ceibae TaxID=1935170 RepID=UPI001C600D78|nr:DUF6545 domain-containing protein [Nonomuraea ceibae]